MKKATTLLLTLTSLNLFAQMGTDNAIENYLQSQFTPLLSYGMLWEIDGPQGCDAMYSVPVTGNLGSGITKYECEVCLVNDGGVYSADSTLSECYREGH